MLWPLTLCGIGFLLRVLPFLKGRQETGVDHWYWLAYSRAVKQGGPFPPALPNYLMDAGQWYPPVFPFLLSRLPFRVIERHSHWMAVSIDMARLAFLLFTVKLLHLEDPWAYGAAGLLYATTPILVSYNTQLNPRGLGALLMDSLWVVFLYTQGRPSFPWGWLTLGFLFCLVLLTHKMTTQVLVFVCLAMAVFFKNAALLGLIASGVLIAWVISRGFYWKVLRAHWDILSFWTREWPLLGADALKESPLYGQKDYQDASRQFEPGFKNFMKRLFSIIAGTYAPIATGALLLVWCLPGVDPVVRMASVWLAACVLFALLTVLVPWLRGLGFGNLYLYNASFPAALILGCAAAQMPELGRPFAVVLLALNVVLLVRSLRNNRRMGQELPQDVIAEIAHYGEGAWMSFPMQWMEQIAYRADKPVLWGAHGYGFETIRQIFPVIRKDFRELMKAYGLRFVLVDDAHRADMKRVPIPQQVCFSVPGFHILELLKAPQEKE